MPLVLRLSKLSRRLAMARRLIRAPLVGVSFGAVLGAVLSTSVASCGDQRPGPVDPPGDTLPPVDPNDPAFQRSVHVVTTTGRWENTGNAEAPWNLATALIGAGGRVTPGDTIWVHGGTYPGAFTSLLEGTAAAPILVRSWPGERAIISHSGSALTTLNVTRPWVTFWGLEVTNANPVRTISSSGSEMRPNGIANGASHNRFINMLVHDAGVGLFNYAHARDVLVYGSVFYNNGWQGSDRGHGHALYVKSDEGPVTLAENVVFNQFGWGIHLYSNAGSGGLNNLQVERNVVFNNGTLSDTPEAENVLLGGQAYSTGSSLTGNVAWFTPVYEATNMRVGFGALQNGLVRVADNIVSGGDPVLRVGRWEAADFQDNVLAGVGRMVDLNDGTLTGYVWDGMTQYRDPLSASWVLEGVAAPFLLWQTLTGLGLSDLVASGTPSSPTVRVWPNQFEPGRALVVVLNWTRASTVAVPLDAVLAPGEAFEVLNIQDLHGPPVLTGTYGGPITVPMTGVSPPAPVGLSSSRAPRTAPDLDVFVIRRR